MMYCLAAKKAAKKAGKIAGAGAIAVAADKAIKYEKAKKYIKDHPGTKKTLSEVERDIESGKIYIQLDIQL